MSFPTLRGLILFTILSPALAAPVLAQVPAGAASVSPGPDNPYLPPACTGIFADVACPGGFAVNWIEQFYNNQITAGCATNPLRYCPDSAVTRAEMAVFVEKAMRGTGAWSPGDLGAGNTGLGAQSLLNNSSYSLGNTAFGFGALKYQSYANGNVAYNGYNTAVGYGSLYVNQPDGGNLGDNGRVNSGFGAYTLNNNTTGYGNTASGFYALGGNTTGAENTAVGDGAGQSNSTGSYDTLVGRYADVAADGLVDATAIGNGAIADASYHVRIGDTNVTQIGGQVGWSNLSDARAKNDITALDLGLDFVMALRPVSFTMKQGNGRTDMGFVAQDVEVLVGDNYNVLGVGGDNDRTLSMRYTDFIAPMVKAIQEQQVTITSQQEKIEALESRLAALEARLAGGAR